MKFIKKVCWGLLEEYGSLSDSAACRCLLLLCTFWLYYYICIYTNRSLYHTHTGSCLVFSSSSRRSYASLCPSLHRSLKFFPLHVKMSYFCAWVSVRKPVNFLPDCTSVLWYYYVLQMTDLRALSCLLPSEKRKKEKKWITAHDPLLRDKTMTHDKP